jgi:DNA-binding NtrC family response regulator
MAEPGPQVEVSVLQVAYAADLLYLREKMLKEDGYRVVSALGNEQAAKAAGAERFDVAVVGFSERHSTRHQMVRWLKQHAPKTRIAVLLAHGSEHFPDADCEALSEDPQVWLEAVRAVVKRP